MKITHRQLEAIRANPKNYKVTLEQSQSGFPRLSKYMCWKHAINFYLKNGTDLVKTEKYFTDMFNNNFVSNKKNERDLNTFIEEISRFAIDFNDLGNETIDTKVRISFDIGHGNTMSGEIHRIDLSIQRGYEAYLIIKEDYIWENELRFPLIQHFTAELLGCTDNEVSVGVYCFQLGEHTTNKYSQEDIEKAMKEVDRISSFLK